jgi:hypothetical protein
MNTTTQPTQLNFLQRLKYAQELWAVVLPAIQVPPNSTFVGWLARFTDNELERALTQVPHRIRNWTIAGTPNADEIYRLISSFLSKAKRRNPANTQGASSYDGRGSL